MAYLCRSRYGRRKQRPLPKTQSEKGVVMVQGRVRRWTASLAVVLLGVLLWPVPGAAWTTDATTFSGQATGVRATVLGITAVVADTGPLPESGGAREASLLNVSAGGLSAEVVHASTVGQGDGTRSEASLASASLALEGNTVSATFLAARASAVCTDQGPQISGGSEVTDLVVNGQSTAITAYTNLGGTVRRIEGTADMNGQSGTFMADVADNGEPGRADTFTLRLSNGYTASGTLDGGNIQLHSPCQ